MDGSNGTAYNECPRYFLPLPVSASCSSMRRRPAPYDALARVKEGREMRSISVEFIKYTRLTRKNQMQSSVHEG